MTTGMQHRRRSVTRESLSDTNDVLLEAAAADSTGMPARKPTIIEPRGRYVEPRAANNVDSVAGVPHPNMPRTSVRIAWDQRCPYSVNT